MRLCMKKGDSASMVEKTRLLAQTDELAQAANRWFELTQVSEQLSIIFVNKKTHHYFNKLSPPTYLQQKW